MAGLEGELREGMKALGRATPRGCDGWSSGWPRGEQERRQWKRRRVAASGAGGGDCVAQALPWSGYK